MNNPARIPEFSKHKIAGQRIRAARWHAEAADAHIPILYFNGIGTKIEAMLPFADGLPEREIISFDMPGVGGSSQPLVPYTAGMAAGMAAKLLDLFDIPQVDVIGLSWGGAIAQQFALQHCGRVRRVVLKATSAGMFAVPGDFSALQSELTNAFEMPSLMGFTYQMMAMAGWASAPFLPFMDKETLIMMGDQDTVVPIANGHILRFLIPNSRLHTIKGGAHLFADSHREETVAELRDFLNAA